MGTIKYDYLHVPGNIHGACFAEIDKAFDNDKISWNDHETLYSLAAAVVAAEN